MMNTQDKVLSFFGSPKSVITATDESGRLAVISTKMEKLILTDIFNCSSSAGLDLFILNDVMIAFDKGIVTIAGKLNLETAMFTLLKPILPSEILIVAEIHTTATSFDEKIDITSAKFSSTVPFDFEITNNFVLKSATLELDLKPVFDSVTAIEPIWTIIPTINGDFEIFNIAKDIVTLQASVYYSNDGLILEAVCDGAEDLLGISWLDVDYISTSIKLGTSSSLDLSTHFKAGGTDIYLKGKLGNETCELSGEFDNFTIKDLSNLFNTLTGQIIDMPDYDITFEKVSISASFANGLLLSAKIKVKEIVSDAVIKISSEGIEITGGISDLSIGEMTIKQARLAINIFSKTSAKKNSFEILGKINIVNIELDCLARYKDGEFEIEALVDTRNFYLSSIIPEVSGTFVNDLRFNSLAFGYGTRSGLKFSGETSPLTVLAPIGLGSQTIAFGLKLTKTPEFSLALNNTELDLGNRIKCDPVAIEVKLSPVKFNLLFGMNLLLANQNPLHFDLMLSVSAVDASGSATMKGSWIEPFGISGLTVRDVALEIGINYVAFAASHMPTVLGIAGKIDIGDTALEIAVKVSEDPKDEILVGKIEHLTTSDLISFASAITSLDIPLSDVPDFFTINNFALYVAPFGGSIGTIVYEKGVSFAADIILFGTRVMAYATFSEDGFIIRGKLQRIDLGILKIGGRNGGDLLLDAEISNKKQAFKFDGEFSFLGDKIGLFVDLSKDGIEFRFERSFLDLLKFEIVGKSTGSLSDLANLDFALTATMTNEILDYIEKKICAKIEEARKAVNITLEKAQKAVDDAEKAYKKLYEPAFEALNKAQKDADAYLDKCVKDIEKAKLDWQKSINDAQNKVKITKAAYDAVFDRAKKAVDDAQKAYQKDIEDAKAKVQKAQDDYNRAFKKATNDVNKAQAEYDRAFGSAQSQLKSAQKEVDKLLKDIKYYERKISNPGWEFYRVPDWSITLTGLYAAYGLATAALYTAQKVVEGIKYSIEYTTLEAAKLALKVVQTTGEYATFESAKATLEYVINKGLSYVAFESAKATLNAVQTTTEYTAWKGAEAALSALITAGNVALIAAQFALDNIARSAAYVALESAKAGMLAVEKSTEFIAFETAKVTLESVKLGSDAVLKISEYILKSFADILNIRKIVLSSSLKKIESGSLFNAQIEAAIFGMSVNLHIDLDISKPLNFVEDLFKNVFAEAKRIAEANI